MHVLLLSCLPSLNYVSFCFMHLGALPLGQVVMFKSHQRKCSSSEILSRKTMKAPADDHSHSSLTARLVSTVAPGPCAQCTWPPQAGTTARRLRQCGKGQTPRRPQNTRPRATRGSRHPPSSNPRPRTACWDRTPRLPRGTSGFQTSDRDSWDSGALHAGPRSSTTDDRPQHVMGGVVGRQPLLHAGTKSA